MGLPFSRKGAVHKVPVWGRNDTFNTERDQMTLCGSEVPQDRWRGRTAGSGMWTRTENLLSWSPSGDSAIPYG